MSADGILPDDTWSARVTPLLQEAWLEARRQILNASRISADQDVWLLEDPDHMGDPAQKVDQYMHQAAAAGLQQVVRGIQVFGEEAPMTQLLLSRDFPYVAYLDAIDGSAQAWALPGCWGHIVVIQQFEHTGVDGHPHCPARYIGVLDAEGGTTVYDVAHPYVSVDMFDQAFEGGEVFDDEMELTYEGETLDEVTGNLVVLVGGYKPHWWASFSELRTRILVERPKAQVFNTGGAPVTRKVIQNADNVVVQLTDSTLWDGAGAALIAHAKGLVIPVGSEEPLPRDEVLAWWNELGFEPDPDSMDKRYRPALRVPAFVAGMHPERVRAVAKLCKELPGR